MKASRGFGELLNTWGKTLLIILALVAVFCTPVPPGYAVEVEMELLGSYHTGVFDESAAEIAAYDPVSQRLFVVNGDTDEITVLDISDPTSPSYHSSIDITPYGDGVNSVDFRDGVLVAAIEAEEVDEAGMAAFFDADGGFITSYTAGVLPDMVTFSPNGELVLLANEGEPDDDYEVDPPGSVTIIDISAGVESGVVQQVDFTAFDGQEEDLREQGVRIFGPGASTSQDLEPEYIAVSQDNSTAWIACQENNALAVVDIATAQVTDILPLGYKDHRLQDNPLDASDEDGEVNIDNWPVFGMYQPDAIVARTFGEITYIFSANEGDARDYDGFSEEERVEDLQLSPSAFPNAAMLQQEENLGRLQITTTLGEAGGEYEELYCYGARSFSVWSGDGELIYDSGSEFEEYLEDEYEEYFNSDNDENDSFDSRSDAKGPEPEGITLGQIGESVFAFIGLERIGGVMVYDVTDPTSPTFSGYVNNRNFDVEVSEDNLEQVGDLGPEGLVFIPASVSPNGQHLLVVTNEVSGSVSIFSVRRAGDSDVEQEVAHLPASFTVSSAYPNPFNPQTRFQLNMHTGGAVTVTLFNSLGRSLHSERMMLSAGEHSYLLHAGDLALSSGTYYLRFAVANRSVMRRAVLLR